jgi:sec-independent protein translocase protein TatB
MFGMGGSEIVVILIVALLFLGPDKLPQAAKTISKGIRDIKKQSRSLQQQIENDEQIGGAIRDLKSALRGEEPPPRPPKPRPAATLPPGTDAAALPAAVTAAALPATTNAATNDTTTSTSSSAPETATAELATASPSDVQTSNAPPVRLPPTAGEPDPDVPVPTEEDDDDLRSLIRPAVGAIAKGSEPKHG